MKNRKILAPVSLNALASTAVALSMGFLLFACGEPENVAGNYRKQYGSSNAAPAPNPPPPNNTEPPATGDAAKGQTALTSCAACHSPTGSASGVLLDASAIPKLDAAFTGAQKAFHSGFPAVFNQPGRADVEAYLKTQVAAGGTPPPATGTPPPATGTPPPPGIPPVATGDAAKGKVALGPCVACHSPAGVAKGVILNAAAIPKLDAAFTGAQKSFHSSYGAVFNQPGRADVEAHLRTLN